MDVFMSAFPLPWSAGTPVVEKLVKELVKKTCRQKSWPKILQYLVVYKNYSAILCREDCQAV